jgi:hypothetical protein
LGENLVLLFEEGLGESAELLTLWVGESVDGEGPLEGFGQGDGEDGAAFAAMAAAFAAEVGVGGVGFEGVGALLKILIEGVEFGEDGVDVVEVDGEAGDVDGIYLTHGHSAWVANDFA